MNIDVFHAIADPTRRAILGMLANTAMTPNNIASKFEVSRQAISKHLQLMAACGLLQQNSAGREMYYRLNADKMKEVDDWLAPFRIMWEQRFTQLDDILNQK